MILSTDFGVGASEHYNTHDPLSSHYGEDESQRCKPNVL